MNEIEPKQYMPKQPIKAVLVSKPEYPGQHPFWQYESIDGWDYATEDEFNEFFVEFDVSTIRQKIEEILDKAIEAYAHNGIDDMGFDDFVDELLALSVSTDYIKENTK